MNIITTSSLAMAIGFLVIIWAFLIYMMMSQADDAHLQFLLRLMGEEAEAGDSSPHEPTASSSPQQPAGSAQGPDRSAGDATTQQPLQHAWHEVPLLFTLSLRGRGM